jgi:hypothetical protein
MRRSKRVSLNVTDTHVSVSADCAFRLLPSLTASRQIFAPIDLHQGTRRESPFEFLIVVRGGLCSAVSYSLHWSGVTYTRGQPVRWLGLTVVKGGSPRIRQRSLDERVYL